MRSRRFSASYESLMAQYSTPKDIEFFNSIKNEYYRRESLDVGEAFPEPPNQLRYQDVSSPRAAFLEQLLREIDLYKYSGIQQDPVNAMSGGMGDAFSTMMDFHKQDLITKRDLAINSFFYAILNNGDKAFLDYLDARVRDAQSADTQYILGQRRDLFVKDLGDVQAVTTVAFVAVVGGALFAGAYGGAGAAATTATTEGGVLAGSTASVEGGTIAGSTGLLAGGTSSTAGLTLGVEGVSSVSALGGAGTLTLGETATATTFFGGLSSAASVAGDALISAGSSAAVGVVNQAVQDLFNPKKDSIVAGVPVSTQTKSVLAAVLPPMALLAAGVFIFRKFN